MNTIFRSLASLLGVIVLLALTAVPASSCGNLYYSVDLNGRPVELDELEVNAFLTGLQSHTSKAEWKKKSRELERQRRTSKDFKLHSDYAVTLLHLGRAAEAIKILRAIEAKHPGEYTIAANLGTAYELNGQDDSALVWISEGIRRNPDSHFGTEWLHARILVAKKELAKDPNWLATHTILGLDFGDDARPELPEELSESDYEERLFTALEYQLHERISFVPPPDPIVADLLFDFANLAANRYSVEHGIGMTRLALQYKPVRAELARKRLEHYENILVKTRPLVEAGNSGLVAPLTMAGAGLVGIGVIVASVRLIQRRRKREQAESMGELK